MKKNILNSQFSILNSRTGFTLIELMVAIFIFSIITVGIVSVFVSTAGSYQKARAIKEVKENIEYAVNSIAKEVRMGSIPAASAYSDGTLQKKFEIQRNRGGTVCYSLESEYILSLCEDTCQNCDASGGYAEIINLDGKGMRFFDPAATNTSGFYSCPSAVNAAASCAGVSEKRRGWVEINFNITPESGKEMEADQISVQTVVSSRDYGWEEAP